MNDPTLNPIWHEGFVEGWTEGREALADTLGEFLYLSDPHEEAGDLADDVLSLLEVEIVRLPTEEVDEE